MISNHRHLGCLQGLLKAAGVPANLPAEAVAEALLQLQLQGQAATLAYNTSLQAACQSLSIAQSAALPTQLPLLRSLHSTTAALGAEDVDPPAAPAEASTQDPSTEPPAQTLADAAASVLQQPAGPVGVAQEPAGPTHAVLDLESAVSAAQKQEQHRRAQRKQQAQPQKRAQKQQQEQGVFASRLFSLSQQLTQDVEQVKMAERAQQVKQKLQRMQTQRQQRQQEQQQQRQDSVIAAGAGAPAGTAPAGLSVQAQRQQQQQAHLAPTLNLAQALETLGQLKLSAYELLVQQRQRQQEQALQELEKPKLSVSELRLQQQQQGQQAADKPSARHSQQQSPRRAVGLPSLEAVIRAHPQLLAKARRQKQQQQQRTRPPGGYKLPTLLEYTLQQQRQQPAAPVAAAAAAAAAAAQQPGGYKLPTLLECTLQQPAAPVAAAAAAAAAAAQQRLSPHPSGSSSSSDLLAAEDWDADVAAPAAGQARYSNWVDLDLTQVVPRDAHDTFLGVWPDLSSLPALQLADLLVDVDTSGADVVTGDVSDLEEMQQLPSAAEADARLVVELRKQQQQQQGGGDSGGTHVESLQAAALQEATAAAQEAAGDSTEDEAVQGQEESLGALFAGSGSWEGLSGLGSSDAAAAADAKAELAQLWQVDASTAAEEGADADPELAQLSQGDAAVAADAAAADAVLMQLQQQQQQRLQQAAATAGLDGATAPSHAATPAAAATAAGDWECEELVVRPRWSVDTMFDFSDGLTVDSTAALISSSSSSSSASGGGLLCGDVVLEGFEWVLTDSDADSELQGGGEGQYGDSLDEVAAAQAALRASDAAAAAFAAANPSQLQWPAHMPIILAWQRALQQLEFEPQLAGAFCLDGVTGGSSSSSAFGGTASGRTVQGQQQPFAWRYQAAGSPGGDAGGQAPSPVVQHILQCMQDMQPNGNWRFELQQQPLLRRKPWAPVDSSLTQYVQQRKQQPQEQQQLWGGEQLSQQPQKQQQQLAGSVEASQRLQAQQQQQQQQAQLQPQQQQEGEQAKHGWLKFGRDLWEAAKDAYWFSSSKGSSSSRGSGSGGAAATMITTTSSEGAWDDDEQQEEPPPAAAVVAGEVTTAAADAAASSDQPIRGRNFVLQPQKLPHSEEELLLLARVTEMSAGTCWEAPMWSVFTQQGTQVPKGRSELQYTSGDVRKGRKPLSEPWEDAVKRREQERQEQAQREQQRLQQAQVRAAALKQQAAAAAAAAAEDWFAPVIYAAFAAVHKTGQLVLLPVYTSLYSTPAVSTSLDTVSDGSNSSSEEAAEAFENGPADVTAVGNVAQQRATAAAAVAIGLQAVPPYKPGWDPLARCWQGRYSPVAAVPSRAQLAAELQQRAQLGQAAIQRARAHAPVDLRLQPDAAHGVILEEIQGCGSAAALLECMQQYAHYLDRYPDLPAAALQQAAKVWTGPAIAGAAAAAAAESLLGQAAASAAAAAAQAVQRAAGPKTGKGRRKHKPLPLKLHLPVAAVPSVDAAPTGAAAAAAAAPAVSMPDITAAFAGGVSTHAAAAAAGGNLDMLQQHEPVQLQLPDKALLERNAAGSVFETLVQWLTKQHKRPVEQLRDLVPPALHADLMPQRSSSSGKAAGAASAADLRPSKQQCLLQLLSLGISHRGTLLPQGVSLLQLLKGQLVQQLPESTVLDLSQHILSPLSGLQSWQVDEQQAAFKLVQSGLVALQPQALLQLLQLLTTQSHLAALPHELQQAPASLYNAVLARLAVQAKAVLDGQTGEVWKEFAGAAPQLLRLAEQACLSAGTLALEAQQEGIVLPGTSYLEGSVAPKAVKGASGEEHRKWVLQQQQAHVKLLRSWRKQAAVTPVVADAVVKAATSGHLMLVAAVLKPILSAPTQQQQLQAAQVAGLLQLLAFSRPFVSYSSASDARHVAARFGVPGDGLWAGSAAFARLPEAAMGWLVQQQGPSKPLQQVSQAAALKTLWAAFQLQLPLKHIGAAVSSLCEPLPATAAGAAASTGPAADGTWPVGRDLWQAVDDAAHNSSSSGGSSSSGTRTYLHGWSAPDLQKLMVLTRIGGFAFHPAHWDVVASAAALRLHELAAAVATGRLPTESTVNLAAYAPGGPTAAAKADIGRHRSSAGGSEESDHQHISRMVDAACDMSFVVTSRDLYYPELVDALQDLVVNAAKVRRSKYSGRAQYLTPHVLSKVLYCLAYFNTCSADTSAAIRQLLPPLLRGLKQQGLSRAAWALAVLDEREPRVWRDVAKAIQRRESGAAGPTHGEEEGDADAAVSIEEKAPYFAQWTYTQVHQANVFVEHCVPDAAPLLPPKLAAKALRLHVTQAQDPTVSQLQRDVGHVLGEMQASQASQLSSYELEHKTVLGSTDIKVIMKGAAHRVAIEVDGPHHYAKNDPYTRMQRNGSTMLRDRLLQVKGFSVLPLPYWELRNKKAAGPDVMLPWLQQLLVQAAARAPPAGADWRRGAKMIELESYTDTL